MASGSQLSFFNGIAQRVNIVLTPDGSDAAGKAIAGALNVEVFTSTAGTLANGFDASAFVQGAQLVNSGQAVQAALPGSIVQLLDGSYRVFEATGNQLIQIVGAAAGGSSITVQAALGDTITGSTVAGNSQLIIPDSSPTFIIGGAGPTTVWAGQRMSITGGAGAMTVDGSAGACNVTGGTGNLWVTGSIGAAGGDTITGAQGAGSTSYITAGIKDIITGGGGNTTVAGLLSRGNSISSAATITGGAGAMTVYGSVGDLITGGADTMQVNAAGDGGETVVGGAGSLSVFSISKNFSITASTGGTTFIDDNYGRGGGSTITGGSGTATGAGGLAVNTVIIGAAGDTVVGGSGTSYIDAINGSQAITVGSGATTVQAAVGDTIAGGSGTLQAYLDSNQATTTINLGAGHGAASLREISVAGGKGGAVSVTGFNVASDVIQSGTSVAAGKFLGTSKSDASGGGILSVLTFVDGTTMTLAGISDPTKITFAS